MVILVYFPGSALHAYYIGLVISSFSPSLRGKLVAVLLVLSVEDILDVWLGLYLFLFLSIPELILANGRIGGRS